MQEQEQWQTAEYKWAKLKEPGDFIEGRLADFDYEAGETMYDKVTPCGFLDLFNSSTGLVTRLDLSKKQILEPFKASQPVRGRKYRITFVEKRESQRTTGAKWNYYTVQFVPGSEHDEEALVDAVPEAEPQPATPPATPPAPQPASQQTQSAEYLTSEEQRNLANWCEKQCEFGCSDGR